MLVVDGQLDRPHEIGAVGFQAIDRLQVPRRSKLRLGSLDEA